MFSRRSYKYRGSHFRRVSSISSLPLELRSIRGVVENVLSSRPTVRHSSCSAAEKKGSAEGGEARRRIGGLPSPADLYTSRCRKGATDIFKDASTPSLTLCPSPHRQEHPESHFSSAQINVPFKPFLYILW